MYSMGDYQRIVTFILIKSKSYMFFFFKYMVLHISFRQIYKCQKKRYLANQKSNNRRLYIPSPSLFHRILQENIKIMLIKKNIDYKIYFCCHIYVTTHKKWINLLCQIYVTSPPLYCNILKNKKIQVKIYFCSQIYITTHQTNGL